jgi:WD40 repeat protein
VTSADEHGVELWDLAAAAPAPVLIRDGRGAPANHSDVPALSPDGTLVGIADSRGQIELLTASDRRSLARFIGHDAPVATAAFSPDGTRLVTATVAGDVRVWRTTAAQEAATLDLGARGSSATFLDDGRVVGVGTTGARIAAVVDGRTAQELDGHRDGVTQVEASADRTRFITGGRGGVARLWRADGTLIAELLHGGDWVRRVGLSADGRRAFTVTSGGALALWRGDDGALERTVTVPGPVFGGSISPDGSRVLTLRDGGTEITVVDADRGTVIASPAPMGQQAVDAPYSADGALVAVPAVTMVMPVFDGHSGEQRFEVEHEAPVMAAAWSPDGARLVSTDLAGVIRVTSRDGARLRTLGVSTGITAVALHPGGAMLAIATQDGVVHVLELAGGRELASLSVGTWPVVLEYAPAGDELAIAGIDGPIRVWHLGRFTGTADQLDLRLRCGVPYRLDDRDGLEAAAIDPAACR